MIDRSTLSPVLFIPHGGGPLPLLGDPEHQQMVEFLQGGLAGAFEQKLTVLA
jgi:hypothetical protein